MNMMSKKVSLNIKANNNLRRNLRNKLYISIQQNREEKEEWHRSNMSKVMTGNKIYRLIFTKKRKMMEICRMKIAVQALLRLRNQISRVESAFLIIHDKTSHFGIHQPQKYYYYYRIWDWNCLNHKLQC